MAEIALRKHYSLVHMKSTAKIHVAWPKFLRVPSPTPAKSTAMVFSQTLLMFMG